MARKILNEFRTEYVQVLDENGNADEKLMPDISDNEIKKMHELMVLARSFDQKAFNMQRQGRLGTYIQIKGQEACQVGSALALKNEDWVFPIYRDSGLLIARNHPIVQILQYWKGDERSMKSPEGINNFPISIPVGTHIPHAVGAAFASKLLGKKEVALVSFGDGATSKGDFHEGLNFAGVFKAPVIFLCQNNQFAISVPLKKQTASETIAQKAVAYGIEGVQVDGNDVFGVYKIVKDAVEKARKGGGATLVECYTYRMADHSTSDDSARYRSKSEQESWSKKDPVERLEKFMFKKGLLNESEKQRILKEAQKKIEEAVEEFGKVPQQDKDDMFRFVFGNMTERQIEELEELKRLDSWNNNNKIISK